MQATPYSLDQQADAEILALAAQLAAARKVCPTAPAAAWYELDFVALEQGGPGGE